MTKYKPSFPDISFSELQKIQERLDEVKDISHHLLKSQTEQIKEQQADKIELCKKIEIKAHLESKGYTFSNDDEFKTFAKLRMSYQIQEDTEVYYLDDKLLIKFKTRLINTSSYFFNVEVISKKF
ncbi:MAG: hypothetical protein JXB49_37140 [Bacteroidales bacterium]|nr:hypothetical protein [Bacteroidales bacterium]